MGTLIYGSARTELVIDDRPLAHVQIVVVTKLRRHEAFAFSWDGIGARYGRRTLWMHQGCDIEFQYDGSKPPLINKAWVELMTRAANSSQGLIMLPEPLPTESLTTILTA